MKHPIIHTTRESFVDFSNWRNSKKGNICLTDHNHSYTILPSTPHSFHDDNLWSESFRAVIINAAGERRDVGPFTTAGELFDALWPEGDGAPIGVEP